MNRVLLIDLETTGLPIMRGFNNYAPYEEYTNYNTSRIIQISILVYDLPVAKDSEKKLILSFDRLITPDKFTIENSHIHGITQETAEARGVKFQTAIAEIEKILPTCNLLVSHNILFDRNVLLSELFRYQLFDAMDEISRMRTFCTMEGTTNILKLPMRGRADKFKYPKLAELYYFLFKKPLPGPLHDGMADVTAAADCFLQLYSRNLINPFD